MAGRHDEKKSRLRAFARTRAKKLWQRNLQMKYVLRIMNAIATFVTEYVLQVTQ